MDLELKLNTNKVNLSVKEMKEEIIQRMPFFTPEHLQFMLLDQNGIHKDFGNTALYDAIEVESNNSNKHIMCIGKTDEEV